MGKSSSKEPTGLLHCLSLFFSAIINALATTAEPWFLASPQKFEVCKRLFSE